MLEQITSLFKDIYSWKFWLICSLILVWTVQMCYYIGVFVRIRKKPKVKEYQSPVPVSVIICARNEAANLREKLPAVLEQDYPDFEVIVVNDGSTDDTALVLAEMKQKYPRLYVTEVPFDRHFSHGKKLAITVGIKAAKNEWLLLTDADCIPVSKWWIKTMSQNFTDCNDFVLGFGGYEQRKGFLNRLIRYDTVFIAMQYYTYTEIGMPYMGVGRNMAYRKSIFNQSRGFTSHSHLMSGDDDIFVNQNAQKGRIVCESNPASFTLCEPKVTFNQWNKQKQRHFTASEKYKPKHKMILALETISRSLFYLGCIVLSFFNPLYFITPILFFTRYFVFLYAVSKASSKFNSKGVAASAVLFDFVLPYINIIQLILGKIRKDRLTWK
ncbi:MAG: glycosyltransferase [Bacteroidales bacterium]|nr:glycosyltransferase [Bacteroidales bacterium]